MRDSIEARRCTGCGVEYYLSPLDGTANEYKRLCVDCVIEGVEPEPPRPTNYKVRGDLSPVLLRVMSNLVERATAAGHPPNEENAEMLRSHGVDVPREGQEGE